MLSNRSEILTRRNNSENGAKNAKSHSQLNYDLMILSPKTASDYFKTGGGRLGSGNGNTVKGIA
jgi:hypothetical protein